MDAIGAAKLLVLALLYAGPGMKDREYGSVSDQTSAISGLLDENIRALEEETQQEDDVLRALIHRLMVSKRARNPTTHERRGALGLHTKSRSRNTDLIRRFPFDTDVQGPTCQISGTCEIGWKRSIRKRRSVASTGETRHRSPIRLLQPPNM